MGALLTLLTPLPSIAFPSPSRREGKGGGNWREKAREGSYSLRSRSLKYSYGVWGSAVNSPSAKS